MPQATDGSDEDLTPVPSEAQAAPSPPSSKTSHEQPVSSSASQNPPRLPGRPRGRGSMSSNPASEFGGLSPAATDRVFPIRSAMQVDSTVTPAPRLYQQDSYFAGAGRISDNRRASASTDTSRHSRDAARGPSIARQGKQTNEGSASGGSHSRENPPRLPPQVFSDIVGAKHADVGDVTSLPRSSRAGSSSRLSATAGDDFSEDPGGLLTTRFKHVTTDEGHAIITGRDGEAPQRCEDEPIHIPGAVQGFGLLVALQEIDGKCQVRIVSENSKGIIGYTPKELFALDSFTDILSEEQAENLLDHIDFVREEDTDVATNGPEVFTLSIRAPKRRSTKLWCALHINDTNPDLIICEFELEDDTANPLVPPNSMTPELPEDTLSSNPSADELLQSTENISRPLRVLRSARKRKGEAAAMEVFNIMSQVQEQLAAAPTLDRFLKVLVGVVKELTGFHRVMIYQFDHQWNGRVVTELVDPRSTKDLYLGLNFPASDIPKQARDLYRLNKVRMLYDRDQETARLVCRTIEDLETPLDLTYAYLRAMSPIHLKYLAHMAVRSSMSISINAFNELWGLISCHGYGAHGMRVAFPIRKMCRLVGDIASRNIERLSYASRLQARKLINTVPSEHNPSGYIIASSEDLLKLFNADCGMLSIHEETKILGRLEQSQEALVLLEYLRMRRLTSVMTSQDITQDFPDLKYPPGFTYLAGMLFVPLSSKGSDFIVFFRKGQLKEVKWAGNPYEKEVKQGTQYYLEPRKSFKVWSETVVGRCREWTEEEVETAAVLCLVYGKFIEVWRQKEAALQNSQLTRLLLANSAHEVRTPLNAIINYLEIALEGSLDNDTRDSLTKSHSASKSLIYVINDLLDLTMTEEGVELIKGESLDLKATLKEATDPFCGDAKRKNIDYEVIQYPGLPTAVLGDQRRIRQAISNITANAIQNTTKGGVKVEMYVVTRTENRVEVEVVVSDTGVGMSTQQVDTLFRELEQVQSESSDPFSVEPHDESKALTSGDEEKRALGLGLAVVARIIRNMNGQIRLNSEEGTGSRFVLQFPFELADGETPAELPPPKASPSTPAASTGTNEITLVPNDTTRRTSVSSGGIERKASSESLGRASMKSMGSANSGRSDVDRLIEAIQEPTIMPEGKRPSGSSRGSWNSNTRPTVETRHSHAGYMGSPRSRSKSIEMPPVESQRSLKTSTPGESKLPFSNTPLRAVRMPDPEGTSTPTAIQTSDTPGGIVGEVHDDPSSSPTVAVAAKKATGKQKASVHFDAKAMRVLVAEDDPVNSRIVAKRMERLGHTVYLTTNGQECASAYADDCDSFDLVLMDMQMPIVDGLTSTKLIRKHESNTAPRALSPRAALNGRIPVIAVSASLLERERQTYVDAGFDAWILKPISFDRLQVLLTGIVDAKVREECLYQPGKWEQGGWFANAEPRTESQDFAAIQDQSDVADEVEDMPKANAPVVKSATAPAALGGSPGGAELSRTITGEEVATPQPLEEDSSDSRLPEPAPTTSHTSEATTQSILDPE